MGKKWQIPAKTPTTPDHLQSAGVSTQSARYLHRAESEAVASIYWLFCLLGRVPPYGIAVRNPSMPDDTQSLDERKNTLLAEFIFDEKRYLRLARFNYYAAQGLLWASLAASSLAALLGLVPSLSAAIEKWQLGLASALSVLFTTFSQQVGFQQRANWHYRKVHRIRTLRRRLQFELPTSPTADDIAAVSNARSAMDLEMSREWEDRKLAKEP